MAKERDKDMIRSSIAALVLSAALVACNQSGTNNQTSAASPAAPAVAASQDLTPEQLGQLGARISKNPSQSQQILGEHGLDAKSFEAKIRKVTEDPEASKRYAAAYQKG
jgi:hypothetical protein